MMYIVTIQSVDPVEAVIASFLQFCSFEILYGFT